MKVVKLVVGQLSSNCYLVYDEKIKEAVIVDPGDDADFVIRRINDLELKPIKVIATHGHFDHLLAGFELQTAFNIPFMINSKDEFLLMNMSKSATFFTNAKEVLQPKVSSFFKPKQEIKIGKKSLKIIDIPGHTPGSVAFYSKKDNFLISGDLVFEEGGVGRTDFSYSNKNDLVQSINKLLKLPDETIVYPGHGNPFTIKELKKWN